MAAKAPPEVAMPFFIVLAGIFAVAVPLILVLADILQEEEKAAVPRMRKEKEA